MKRQLTFKGTHKGIGEQVGNLYKNWGKKEVTIPPLVSDYFSGQLDIYQKFFPQYLEYLEGVSVGLGIEKDKVLQSFLTGFLPIAWTKPSNKCSVFIVKNSRGIWVGRNYDWRESSEKHSALINFEYVDDSSNNFTGITDMGTWEVGVIDGSEKFVISFDEAWNEHGLYVAINGAPGNKQEAGMSTPHLVQLLAENTKTTAEAIELVSQIPIPESKLFTISDKSGKIAVVEKSIEKGTKVRESNDLIITTNHYNHPDLLSENIQIFKDVPFHSTFARYHYIQYNLAVLEGELDLDKINALMMKPPVMQNWRGKSMGDVITDWTTAINLSDLKYQIQFAPLGEITKVVG